MLDAVANRFAAPATSSPKTPARTVAHEAPGTAVMLPLVAADLGIALVPASVRAAPLAGVVFRDVPDAASLDLALAWRTDDTDPALLAVLEVLERAGLFSPVPELDEVTP